MTSLFLPLPYYIEMPGSADDVQQFVTVDGQKNEHTGAYLLTTVGIRQATPLTLLTAKFNDFQEVETKEALFGDNNSEEYDLIGQLQMSSSENMAKKVALDLAKEPYTFVYEGVFIHSVVEGSDFEGKLKVGDVVYKVDEHSFDSSEQFMTYVKGKKLGESVTLTIKRDDKTMEISGKLIKLPATKNIGIGITLSDKTSLESDRKIAFEVEDIGGPSAGLMFTLEIYEGLIGQSLRNGHIIAGTGEIKSNGDVGMIGGIDKKIVAADQAGADIFFAPSEEYPEDVLKEAPDLKNNYEIAKEAAKKIKTDMKIVPVKNVKEALAYLETLK
ncbi:PDZ domain-containing protein [Vagococcus xieshaowenii]|uniref:endopeptidase La n=2 Tax=Vagococcus xieshaowenii TaxID=2562451 RepID=A0AAJ5EH96_9ENTE|nr:SepM family pheromone-processing serine protease [Vagococcus xieshaowenii]QCA29583.1 PDZ domain-containing protein [Vagococcus xieshaowenii]TFZ42889.1 PDZ domain-containing protein [Vagococcus xieshaowenii]